MKVIANETFLTTDPVLFDALYIIGGTAANQAKFNYYIEYFIDDAFKHYMPIGFATTSLVFFEAFNGKSGPGIDFATDNPEFDQAFVKAIAQQRF